MPKLLTRLTWTLFLAFAGLLFVGADAIWTYDPLFRIDGLTRVMAALTTLVSGLVQSFSLRYMAGARRLRTFYARLFGLTGIVLVLTAADHVVLFAGAWTAMGWTLADLIGHLRNWPQARAAARYARSFFLAGSLLLAGSLTLLATAADTWSIQEALAAVGGLSPLLTWTAAIGIVGAAMIQSALVPFNRWLLSSMTAPTPVSAFMHAGLVNAGGVLIARFAPLTFHEGTVMGVIVLVGGLSALIGQAWMLVQTDVKRQLGSSTVAQMGFMVLQCGLGFVAAAITHLVLHGFYKAYFFLASGTAADRTPKPEWTPSSSALKTTVAVGTAILGGLGFAAITGKSLTAMNSGTLLVFFVVMAVLHTTLLVLRRPSGFDTTSVWLIPVLVLPALGLYGAIYNGISALMVTVPMAEHPTSVTALHGALAVIFLLAYVAFHRGWHRKSIRLYTALVDSSQPAGETILDQREQYNAY